MAGGPKPAHYKEGDLMDTLLVGTLDTFLPPRALGEKTGLDEASGLLWAELCPHKLLMLKHAVPQDVTALYYLDIKPLKW